MSIFSIKKTAIGIDIFDQAIEVVLLEKKGGELSLVNKGRVNLAVGVITQGKIIDKKLLADTLITLFKKNKIKLEDHKTVVFGLPDDQSYVHTFTTAKINKGEYDDLVLAELTKIIPIPVTDLTAGYTMVSDKKEKVNIISVGGDRSIVTDWQNFFLGLGVKKVLIAPEKTTTEIGYSVATILGLSATKGVKSEIKKKKVTESEYVEAIGLAVSGLDSETYKVPFFNDLLSNEEIKEKSGTVDISNRKILEDEDESNFDKSIESDDFSDEDKKIKKQKLILAIIAVFGLVGISLAFWYQAEQTKQQQAFIESKRTNFSVVQPFTLDIPIATDESEKAAGRAYGRLVVDVFNTQAERDEAVAFSKIRAGQSLLVTEGLWAEPLSVTYINDKTNKKITSYDYKVTWLVYNKEEVNTLAVNRVSSAVEVKGVKFAINNVERTAIKETDNPNLLLISVTVNISLAKNIQDVIINQ